MERIARVDWTPLDHRTWSRYALMAEHVRRMALWNRTLGCGSKTPFFDLAGCVSPDVEVAPELVQDIVRRCDEAGAGHYDLKILPAILRWYAVASAPGVELPELDDPYEPLLRCFERGGGHHRSGGGIELGFATMTFRNWPDRADRPAMERMDDDALDVIDREGSIKQFGKVFTAGG
jgi:hypothetical protein